MPIITFVRHAEALHNADHRARGVIAYRDLVNRDAPLTPTGIQQTQREMNRYVDHTYDVIYCSPLKRCRQTLLGVYPAAHDRHVLLDDMLMEPQGDHTCNWRADKAVLKADIPQKWDLSQVGDANPGKQPRPNETREEFSRRIRRWSAMIAAKYDDDTRILVVTHHLWTTLWFDLHLRKKIGLANCEGVTVRWPQKS